MKIGRNDPCPCGSGKKYKNCCLRKETMSIPDRIREAVRERGYKEDIGDVLSSMYRYMERKQWWGACHATCAALYVCLTEIGYTPDLCIGEVLGQGLYFDHSWISLDDKMIDLAISMTLLGGAPASGVIVFGKDIKTGLGEIKKCEEFCRRLDNENIKFSVLIGSPNLCAVRIGDFSGILEYVWEWPSEKYPDNYRIQAPKELIEEEYYSRFMKGLWVVPDRTEEEVAVAAIAAGKARFEFGEKPDV